MGVKEDIDELKDTLGMKVSNLLNNFELPQHILKINFALFGQYVLKLTETKELIYQKERNESIPKINLEISRLMFNYLVSANALIDHYRIFISKLKKISQKGYTIESFMNNEIELIKSDGVSALVKDLGNSIKHEGIFNFGHSRTLNGKEDSRSYKFQINKEDLLSLKLTNKAKEFVEKYVEKSIDLLDLFKNHFILINNLYSSMNKEIEIIYKNDFDHLHNLQDQLRKKYKGLDLLEDEIP